VNWVKSGFEYVKYGEVDYPESLLTIRDFPKVLFYKGDLSLAKKRCVAVAGSRKTTQYGRNIAEQIGKRLAEKDITVVSGMARGIDTCAHTGALEAGGNTIAVLGCGTDVCYPAENRELKLRIERCGLILSEYPPGTEPRKYYFPQRNRIISGLSEATVIVQAGNNSGALITAEYAIEQGRDVFAVPGNIDSRYNLGNNKLLKEGAIAVTSIEDILEYLGVNGYTRNEAKEILGKTEMEIYDLLTNHGELSIDDICRIMSKPTVYIASIVSVMELKGVVMSALGKIFIANG
jgi:DNA processing protein